MERREPPPPLDSVQRVWLQPPDRYRAETDLNRRRGEPVIESLVGEDTWSYDPLTDDLTRGSTRGSFARLTTPGLDSEYLPAPFDVALHPALVEPFMPPAFDRLEVLGSGRHAGRDAVRALAAFEGWDHVTPFQFEDFPPADDYALLVDAETGVLLRIAARFDGREFSITEMLDVAFDEPFDPLLFEPPPVGPGLTG